MIDLSIVTVYGRLAALGLLAAAFLAFLAIVGLRLIRRGESRFWAAPGVVALVMLPVALGAGLTALEFRRFLSVLADLGSVGPSTRAGAGIDVLIPLLVSLLAAAPLALFALLVIAVGRSNVKAAAADDGASGQAVALVAVSLGAGLVVFVVQAIATALGSEQYLPESNLKVYLSLLASAVLATFLLMLVLFTALRAPRSAAPPFVKRASLSVVSLCGIVVLVGLFVVQGRFRCYATTMSTGEPCDAAIDPAPLAASDAGSTPGLPAVPEVEPASVPREAAVGATPTVGREMARTGEKTSDVAAPARRKKDPSPVRVGGAIKEPRKIKNVLPLYPPEAIRAKVEGIVILECTIGPEGDVTRVTVLRGIPLLDQAAIDAVKQWVYAPTLVNGVAAPVIMTVTANFKLQSE